MTDPSDPRRHDADTGGDPSSRSGSMATMGSHEAAPTGGDLHPDHDQPVEGGAEEAEDGDGDDSPRP